FEFCGRKMHAGERPDDFKMAQFLGPDVHKQIFPLGVLAVEALNRVLHCSGKLAVGTAELLQQHVAEFWIGRIDADRVHELLDVMVHYLPRSVVSCGREASHLHQTSARANVPVAWEYCAWVAIAGLATAQRRKACARGV